MRFIFKFFTCLFFTTCILSSCAHNVSRNEDYRINQFSYKGHSYISFKPVLGYGSTVIHDPNCSCYCYDK